MEDFVNNIWNNYGNTECIYFCKTCKKCILNENFNLNYECKVGCPGKMHPSTKKTILGIADNFKKNLEDSNFKEIVLEEFKED